MTQRESAVEFHRDPLLFLDLPAARDAVWLPGRQLCVGDPAAARAVLTNGDTARVLRDQTLKLRRLLALEAMREKAWKELRAIWVRVSAGLVVRRELRGRATGRRPRRLDLTGPVVDLLPELGMDRAVDSVTAILTAIAGPPGSAAACLVYEITRPLSFRGTITRR